MSGQDLWLFDTGVVDYVVVAAAGDAVQMLLADAMDWSDALLHEKPLVAKVSAYLDLARDGRIRDILAKQGHAMGPAESLRVRIRVISRFAMPPEVAASLVRRAADRGVELTSEVM